MFKSLFPLLFSMALCVPILEGSAQAKSIPIDSFLCKERGLETVYGMTTKDFHASICYKPDEDRRYYIGQPVRKGSNIMLPVKLRPQGNGYPETGMLYEAQNKGYTYSMYFMDLGDSYGILTVSKGSKILLKQKSNQLATGVIE